MVSYIRKKTCILRQDKEYLWLEIFEGEDTVHFLKYLAYYGLVLGPSNGWDQALTPYLLQEPPLWQVLSTLNTPKFFIKD